MPRPKTPGLVRARRRRRAAAATLAVVVTLIGATSGDAGAAAMRPDGPVVKAKRYGAICDGTMHRNHDGLSVDRVAVQAAITAAEKVDGSTVVLPGGTCILDQALYLGHGSGITLQGTLSSTGKRLTTLTDTVNPKSDGGDLMVTSSGNTVQNLILDQSAYGLAAYVSADDTTFQHMTALGGPDFYALFFVALRNGQPAVGNQLLSDRVVSLVDHLVEGGAESCDDGLSWANQDSSVIDHLTFVGTRLALYQDSHTAVDYFTYHPGPQTCGLDGYYITEPSSYITMRHLLLFGSAGVIGNGSHTDGFSTHISITGETVFPPAAGRGFTLDGSSHGLIIRNVKGVTIDHSDFASGYPANASIEFQPTVSTSGVVVEDCTLPRVSFFAQITKGYTKPGVVLSSTFHDDDFPALGSGYTVDDTFDNGVDAAVNFAVSGGDWYNHIKGRPKTDGFVHGQDVTYTVSDLAGY